MKKMKLLFLTTIGALALVGCTNSAPATSKGYNVSFNTHGGTAVETMENVKKIETSPVTTRDGYNFVGWFDSALASAVEFTFPYTVTKDTTMHAKWQEITYTVTFDTDGGSPVEPMANIKSIQTSPVTEKDGFNFAGWYTSKTATEAISFPYAVDHDQTLYAKWTAKTYTVHFDTDGGSLISDMEGITVIEEEPVTTKAGCEFLGWFLSKTDTERITFPYTVTDNITLYARWDIDKTIIQIDGYAVEYIWTTDVMATKATVGSGDYYTDIYGTKLESGLYLYIEQHVAQTKTHDNNWWENNNVELRFGNEIIVPDTGAEQYWYSSINGGQGNHGTVAYQDMGETDGIYQLQWEILIPWNELPVSYSENVLFTAGCAYATGFVTLSSWGRVRADKLNDYHIVNANGVTAYEGLGANFFERTGTELLAEPVTRERDEGYTWDSNMAKYTMNGNASWELRIDLHSSNAGQEYNDCGWVGEVYSPSWANGGWTFRQDWWGWGAWSQGGTDHTAGPHGDFVDCNDSNIFSVMQEKDAVVFVKFDATLGRIGVRGMYTSTKEGSVGAKVYVAYTSQVFDYRGNMIAAFGFCNGAVTINSVQLISGALAE